MRKAGAADSAPTPKPQDGPARAWVARLVQRRFGERPRGLQALGGGLNNHVYQLQAGGQPLVVRLHQDPGKLAVYRKEAWAMGQARKAGVPTPQVLEVGEEGGHPYMLQRLVEGIPGTQWADGNAVLRQMGELAARLHQVATQGFGPAVGGSAVPGQRSWPHWADFLDHELRVGERLGMLDRVNALPTPARQALTATLAQMRRWSRRPVLQHGDLRLKNVIVSPRDGRIVALIDWEDCLSAPPPHWELAIALHDLGPDGKEVFLEGYGLSAARFARIAPQLRALNVLNYAWAIHLALQDGQRRRAEWMKARLRGVFDVAL
ncbi:phosphotransferase family protein [Ramlibacter tataouinensis]|uniref:Neomycin-kanamycin phosphotransferase, type V n=1 Tax=Ramlibacter tataouinensis (strain ATCC BAA-407 / DSM 14655 / LMG 21543 / TTB310) TaxID=365046 RepID=F5Y3R6_RAMTT|nr:aminoglycoside phosphotransferase family protein [Ramlibacter tataouinensis]AEG93723.1 Neomycin-kanamycin phosphotransferase, type V [Ramlibacter tataouinensis TTB310]